MTQFKLYRSTGFVETSGNQTISDNKTFTGTTVFNTISGTITYSPSEFKIIANTEDGSDTSRVILGGGGEAGGSRGATLYMHGNEHSSFPGEVYLYGGDAINGHIHVQPRGSSAELRLYSSNNLRWKINTDGKLEGQQTGNEIITSTSDGSDTAYSAICGGGNASNSRGALLSVWGNESASNAGSAFIYGGNVATGHIYIQARHASANVYLATSNTTRWRVEPAGDFMPLSNGSYDICRSAWRAKEVWSNSYLPFTGAHAYKLKNGENVLAGDAVSLDSNKELILCSGISQSSTCIGLYTGSSHIADGDTIDSCGNTAVSGTTLYSVAAVGDNVSGNLNGFKVCDEGGSISAGDLLVTSSGNPGYLKAQGDDTIKSYTVGKALEDVTFSGGVASGIYGIICCG